MKKIFFGFLAVGLLLNRGFLQGSEKQQGYELVPAVEVVFVNAVKEHVSDLTVAEQRTKHVGEIKQIKQRQKNAGTILLLDASKKLDLVGYDGSKLKDVGDMLLTRSDFWLKKKDFEHFLKIFNAIDEEEDSCCFGVTHRELSPIDVQLYAQDLKRFIDGILVAEEQEAQKINTSEEQGVSIIQDRKSNS